MEKVRVSVTFDTRPDQETGVTNAVTTFLKNFQVNRIRVNRKLVRFNMEVREHG